MPGRVLPELGADFVVALNAVPGPADRKPLGKSDLAEGVYRLPGVDRVVDLLTAVHHLAHRMTDADRLMTHVFIESSEDHVSTLGEAFLFMRSAAIVAGDDLEHPVGAAVEECRQEWKTWRRYHTP